MIELPAMCGGQHHLIMKGRFHLATFIPGYLVSTVGEIPDPLNDSDYYEIGINPDVVQLYETMVFRTATDGSVQECGLPEVVDWMELEAQRYSTAIEANAGHVATVAKWSHK